MLYEGRRQTVPSSRWGSVITVIEATGWSYEQICEAPADLIDEILARAAGRAAAQRAAQ